MEKLHNLREHICSFDNLFEAYRSAAKGKEDRPETVRFAARLEENLMALKRDLENQTYHVGKYREFYVRYPKKRLVMAISFRDRVAQWAVYRQIDPYIDKRYIEDSYGCRRDKGPIRAAEKLLHWIREVGRKPDAGDWWMIKGDISKYFYRVDHEIALDCYREICDEEWFLWLMDEIINNRDVPFGLPEGMTINDCPREKRLFEVGQPIGNLTSQETANLYLNRFDQYVKHGLKIHRYIRYMDDFTAIVRGRKAAEETLAAMGKFLESELRLKLSPKCRIIRADHPTEFVGYMVGRSGIRLRKKTRAHMKRSILHITEAYRKGEIELDDAIVRIECYRGMTKPCRGGTMRRWMEEHVVLTRERVFYRIIKNKDDGTVDVWLTPGTAVPIYDSLTGRYDYNFRILAVRGLIPWDGMEEDIRNRYTDWVASAEEIEI